MNKKSKWQQKWGREWIGVKNNQKKEKRKKIAFKFVVRIKETKNKENVLFEQIYNLKQATDNVHKML